MTGRQQFNGVLFMECGGPRHPDLLAVSPAVTCVAPYRGSYGLIGMGEYRYHLIF